MNFHILKNPVTGMESSTPSITPASSIAQLYQESIRKDKCTFNDLIYGISECSSSAIPNCILDDKIRLTDVTLAHSISLSFNSKPIRLRKFTTDKHRPLNILYICSFKDDASTFVSELGTAEKNGLSFLTISK